jgi:MFS family permease
MVQYTTEYEDKAFEQDPVPSHIEESENHLQVKLSRHGLPLVPQPSDDPFDPLNWSTSQKLTILAIICVWSFMGTLNIINVAPAFFAISEDLNCSLSAATYLVGAPLLAYGMGSLIWVALGNRFGVRTMFVLASFVGGVFSIWGALSSNYASLVAARTLASLFMAAPETLGPQAIADVFFLGDRAKCMALFTLFETSGFSVGSLIGAFITANLGWRWVEWVQAILTLSTCALIAILLPETQYTRRSANAHHRKRRLVDNFRFWPVSGGGEKKVEKYAHLLLSRLHRFSSQTDFIASLWRAFIYPFRYILHPAVIIMTIHFSVLLLTANYMLTSNTFIYETEYGFDIKQTGLTGFAPFVGTLIAIPYSGLINDWYIERLRQRKDFQPEMRLPFFLLTAIITPVGCIIIGVCAQQQTLWVVPLVGEAFGSSP